MNLYGLKNCDSCRNAKKALESKGFDVAFRDVRAEPLTSEEIVNFLAEFGEKLVNTRSTTWRGLSETERAEAPEMLLARHPALMKRPIIEGTSTTLGWDKAARAAHLGE